MDAKAVPLNKILDTNMQMIIPIFQREYSWEKDPVKVLWEDILKLYNNIRNNEDATHFLGPIVRVEVSKSSVDTKKGFLIDGQQRITTLMILLSCLRNEFKKVDKEISEKIDAGYLINRLEKEENRYKLIPSEGDRESFKKIIDGETNLKESKMKDTFDFFTKKIESMNGNIDLEKLRGLIINNIIIVNIDVEKGENPYLIFESLNAKGTPLSQADLVRNYIFMKVNNEEIEKKLYKEYWRPMDLLLGKELENFFWRYSLKDGSFVKMERTYANLKSELENNTQKSAESELKKLCLYSEYYKNLINPEIEKVSDIKKRLIRHNIWEIRTAYPLLLNLYKDYSDLKITLDELCKILDIIESFVIRRFFCKDPTNKYNTLFISIYSKLNKADIINSFISLIIDEFPTDEKFIRGLKEYPIYKSGNIKSRFILSSIEENFKHKEKVDTNNLQVEHIMPQAIDPDTKVPNPERLPPYWKEMLGSDYKRIHQECLNNLGNLTITGFNQHLSNRSFEEKKKIYLESHLELNKYFKNIEKWNEEEINKRANEITKLAVSIWPFPFIDENILKKYKSEKKEPKKKKLGSL